MPNENQDILNQNDLRATKVKCLAPGLDIVSLSCEILMLALDCTSSDDVIFFKSNSVHDDSLII